MPPRKILETLTQLLGINFIQLLNLKRFIFIFFHLSVIVRALIFLTELKIKTVKRFDVYAAISYFQNETLTLIHLTIVLRAFFKRKIQEKIYQQLLSNIHVEDSRVYLKFLMNIAMVLLMRFGKISVSNPSHWVQHVTITLSELTFASSDFMFQQFILLMINYLRKLRRQLESDKKSVQIVHSEILAILSVVNNLKLRYSTELFISISYNFIHLIIALYYTCMRVIFDQLKSPQGKFSGL